jgi:hypothetical protein
MALIFANSKRTIETQRVNADFVVDQLEAGFALAGLLNKTSTSQICAPLFALLLSVVVDRRRRLEMAARMCATGFHNVDGYFFTFYLYLKRNKL